jgi:UDP-2,3-diacylglucosamine pyrophosphatase LpxH
MTDRAPARRGRGGPPDRHVFAMKIIDKPPWLRAGSGMLERASNGPRRVRTLFLSDVHLGTRGCQADKLLDFLRHYEAQTVYLVGDIVDGWQLSSSWYWPQLHNDIVQKLLRQARKGARLFYIPGNHDEFLRDYYGSHFGGIEVLEDAVHVGTDGRHYLVIHGDLFDVVIRHARWLAHLGDNAYELAIWLNTHFNAIRRLFGLTYWSLSQWAKLKVKNAVNFIGAYENTLAAEARRRGVEGVICGHIHHAVIRDEGGLCYINCGDWVESCTAVVEHFDGRFELVRWTGPESRVGEPTVVAAPVPATAGARPGLRPAAGGLRTTLQGSPGRRSAGSIAQ